jgi:DNA-binding transcriptional ArsR family regulator
MGKPQGESQALLWNLLAHLRVSAEISGYDRQRAFFRARCTNPQSRARAEPDSIVSVMANDPFKALAHPIRRGIVERLAGGPATIGEATGDFGVSKPTISKHVKVLEEAGVVVRSVEGRSHQLALDLDGLADAVDWLDRQRAIWERMFDVVDDYLEEQKEAR